MRQLFLVLPALLLALVTSRTVRAADPEYIVRTADEILLEQTQMAGKRIPESLLADAQGVAIIPDVIKIGFVAAVRRGHGVVMVRDANGAWTLPQFITLTGGSVGWQAGIQGTDVVLVFTTKKSVQGLLNGKFTIGADASAAAGPVGRNASAATDAKLQAEILSYSRSRGLFAGVSLDGSVIEMDPADSSLYYDAPVGQPPARVPESALKLVSDLTTLSSTTLAPPVATEPVPMPSGEPAAAQPAAVPVDLRGQLGRSARQLYGLINPQWQSYLALPREVFEGGNPPPLATLQDALAKYDRVVQSPNYEALVSRPEFQTTYGLLRDYVAQLSEVARPTLALPPPPGP